MTAIASAITVAGVRRALTELDLLPHDRKAEHRGGPRGMVTRPDGTSQPVATGLEAYDYRGANVA